MNIPHRIKILSRKLLKKRKLKILNSEYAKKLESILIFVMEIIFPNKNQFIEKLNIQTPSNIALPVNEMNIKSNEKNENLLILRSFFEKLIDQPMQIEIPKVSKKSESNLSNYLMIANNNQYFDNKNNNLHSSNLSNMSGQSSKNSQVSHLVNNIEEALDSKRKLSNPFIEDISIAGSNNANCNSPYIGRAESNG